MSAAPDFVTEVARRHVAALHEAARDMLQMLALLPPHPNTISKDAALHISSGYLAELEELVTQGAVQETSSSRYTVTEIFRPALEQESVPAERKRRLTEYYAQYAYVHAEDRASIEAEYENLNASLLIAESISAGFDQKRIALGLANSMELRGDFGLWLGLLNKALASSSHEPSENVDAVLLLHLARLQIRQGHVVEAEASALRALAMNPEPRLESNLEIALGHAALDASKYEEAEGRLRRALKLAGKAGDRGAVLQALVILGTVLTKRSNYQEAERYTTAALAEAQAVHDLSVVASLGTNLGVLQYHQGLYAKAVETYDQALSVARSVRFREKEGALLQAMGGALGELDRTGEALEKLNEAITIFEEIGHRWYQSITLKERGLVNLRRRDLLTSMEDFERAMSISPGVKEIEGHCRWGMSRALAESGQRDQALEQATLSVRILEEIGDHRSEDARRWLSSLSG